ncbi:N-6 DNA methylase [Lacticaseibacillus paracasei]|uniref:Methylase n=1 Tax=Lacticaseibacillus paracasei subsp. paracasei Lpp225 TaxID=1256225 RepID=S2P330_LACPA|nr:N-6 DNA methylase [Lacticaseibacillus paracasei]EPC37653.1 methylase [Lacticaseibacillus paracasei subsp. paracasei Lpp225]MBT9261818.1 SAM-dependent methyltransferase [Lacticaseibacillus paracasei]QPC21200.1 N-6 DNA methylase [Lacticaseibacillus paracasei subsp. tolerans]UWP75805.1 SAM-dependent methyltransferase [Lacticaseibacillus paracasei]
MTDERLIKSTARVKGHGEVFTPRRIVKLMLDQRDLQENLTSLTSTFLEPAAGEGAFLTEILNRKIALARKISHTISEFEQNILLALTSLYGVELLEDNTELLVMNMYHVFYREYINALTKYHANENTAVTKSAMTIIKSNMAHGDALTGKTENGEDIILSEWKIVLSSKGNQKIQRTEYTFDAIKNSGPSINSCSAKGKSKELSLFDDSDFDEVIRCYKYVPVKITDIYKEKMIEVS